MYGVLVLVMAFPVAEMIVHPRLYRAVGAAGGISMLVFLLLTVAAIVHTVATTLRAELWRSGMALRLSGAAGVRLLFPVLPFALAAAVRRNARWSEVAGS